MFNRLFLFIKRDGDVHLKVFEAKMPLKSKTTEFAPELAGRLELARDGDCITTSVDAALDEMGKALDQLEPSSSNNQSGMAPRDV